MDLVIVGKGGVFDLEIATKQEGAKQYYFGAGWDNPNGPVDLDIVAAVCHEGGLMASGSDFIYFGNQSTAGVKLSDDNTTGEGEGDDEDIVISVDELPASVTSVVVGLAAYAGADLHNAPNTHFRVCDGNEESAPQMADVKLDGAAANDTVLVAFRLDRTDAGWKLTNVDEFHAMGQATAAIQGFAGLFKKN